MEDEYTTVSLRESASRRDFIHIATGAVATFGVGALAWPLVAHMNPAKDVNKIPLGIDVDLSAIAEGEQLKILWYGRPVFIRHRTAEEIRLARKVHIESMPDPETDDQRLVPTKEGDLLPQYLVIIGLCTHFGCVPVGEQGDFGGWYCPCHGSHFDTSGRIRKGPAPRNMVMPPYEYLSEKVIRVLHPAHARVREIEARIY